jgi:sigma-B regulation protein RsbU (phosphoserine phosphatase)
LNKGELVDIVLEEARRVSYSRVVSLFLRSPDADIGDLYVTHDRMKRHIRLQESVSLQESDDSRATNVCRLDTDDGWRKVIQEEFGADVNNRLRIQLLRRETVIGCLDLFDPPEEAIRNQQLIGTLSALADLFVIAWDNAELYDQMRQKSLENDLLLESVSMLSSSLDVDEVLQDMMRALKKVVDYDAVGIFLVNRKTNRVEPRVWQGYAHVDGQRHLGPKVGEGLVGWVVESGEGVYVPDTRTDQRYFEARSETRSELVVPIKADDQIIGAFNLESDKLDAYSEEDLNFLAVFASQAAVSIERARLHREILANKRLQEQLNVARMIQSSFLPRKNPDVRGFDIAGRNIPSLEVGGDYYDFIEIVDNQIGIAIADVSGKGMPASLIMAAFRASLIAEIRNNYAIRTILQKVNRLLNESIDGGNFVTAVYGVLDSKNRIFTFSNAGHNPPILIRKDGSYEELTEGGLALGIIDNRTYEERPVYVAPGDLIVCFTDGVTEATNSRGELFGEQLLISILVDNRAKSAEELVGLVIDSVNEFVSEEFEPDDLTLIVVKAE